MLSTQVLAKMFQQRAKVKEGRTVDADFRFFQPQNGSIVRFLEAPDGPVCISRKRHYNVNSDLKSVTCADWIFRDGELVWKPGTCPVCKLIEKIRESDDEEQKQRIMGRSSENMLCKTRYIWPNVFIESEFTGKIEAPKDPDGNAFPMIRVLEKGPKFFDAFLLIAFEEQESFGDITSLTNGATIKIFETVTAGWSTWSLQVLQSHKAVTAEMAAYIKEHLISIKTINKFYTAPNPIEIISKFSTQDALLIDAESILAAEDEVVEDEAVEDEVVEDEVVEDEAIEISPIQLPQAPVLSPVKIAKISPIDLKAKSLALKEKLAQVRQIGR